MIRACMLIRSERGRFREVAERVKQFKEVKDAFTVLGRYDVVADLEAEDFKELSSVALRIGRLAGVVFTETLVEVQA
ncbi:MAG: Lrp/AsnC ligand binding domain-containing protein [Candidatus Nezhaarchaeota archaeon]|nr:Lrp/AsnC ligand binding domain-containing protein [Candidatus Nezhaarchaeota archaeon]